MYNVLAGLKADIDAEISVLGKCFASNPVVSYSSICFIC